MNLRIKKSKIVSVTDLLRVMAEKSLKTALGVKAFFKPSCGEKREIPGRNLKSLYGDFFVRTNFFTF